jgi:syntaxin 1A
VVQTQEARQALADIEARHEEIINLEKNIRELRDLFIEMASLVETQVYVWKFCIKSADN